MREAVREPGFGIYVHWPFCAAKCPYCDFNSHVRERGVDADAYLAAYLREIDTFASRVGPQRVLSVFFGGGTPSLMPPAVVASLLQAIDDKWPIEPGAEITLEANPTSVDAARFAGYRAAGVNRVSLGIQSLVDADLKALGRLHSVAEARAAISVAQQHFERMSFDLIYARPRQTPEAWRAELECALALQVGHLSVYQLTIESGTAFAALYDAGRLQVPPDETAHTLFEITQELCEARGLPAYEVSNHAAPGQESRHNLLYWRYGAYVGLGAGAHSRLLVGGRRLALSNERLPERWAERVAATGSGAVEEVALTIPEQADEMLLMGLRLSEGVDLARLTALTGLGPSHTTIADLTRLDLLEPDRGDGRMRATQRGRFVLNELVLQLSRGLDRRTIATAAD
jgi:oxygen-independent coproporphyrinogen-3 oxidase